ncbi:MAG: hypothetical protein ACFFG0_40285 [Candidatus Thorarchaeota archaeon]
MTKPKEEVLKTRELPRIVYKKSKVGPSGLTLENEYIEVTGYTEESAYKQLKRVRNER